MPKHPKSLSNRQKLLVTLIAACGLFVLWTATASFINAYPEISFLWNTMVANSFKPNLAQETAKPIEKGLKDAGAVKVSGGGDGGYGLGNDTPGYSATLTVPLTETETIELVRRISSENGFNLNRATREDKGPLVSIADEYIDNMYYDFESRESNFSDLQSGKIELKVSIEGDDGQTQVGVSVNLPARQY
jgi:hypothetical protein